MPELVIWGGWEGVRSSSGEAVFREECVFRSDREEMGRDVV